ncbi:mitochondrial carrier [Rhizodiscina lignyota]|uniref:Mitochondrial carrier n=1 Tax=Rhizodiscina lignyota TaxID=1504668 RepID=A0A9P4MBX7_9PEZI|nr:mitochondrial carrier [Rhizodiscina lignyota]
MSADFWSSYLSGAIGILIGNPLDLLKTRLQASIQPSPSAPSGNFPTATSLLRGAPAPLLGYGALNSILFVTYNRSLNLLGEADYSNPHSLGRVWAAGALGGLATWVVSAPTELVKCRAQVLGDGVGGGIEGGGRSGTNSWSIAKDIWRREGVPGLYFGGAVTSVRDAVGYGFYFWSYELCKQAWTKPNETDRDAAIKVLVCGGIAGVITWASIFPLDVIKTRVQTQPYPMLAPEAVMATEGQALLRPDAEHLKTVAERRIGAFEVARQAYQNEGAAVFFRGLGVCSVRAFIVNAVQWAAYEWMMQLLRKSDQMHKV